MERDKGGEAPCLTYFATCLDCFLDFGLVGELVLFLKGIHMNGKMPNEDKFGPTEAIKILASALRERDERIAELEGALKYYMRECPCNHGGPCNCLIAKQALSPKEKGKA